MFKFVLAFLVLYSSYASAREICEYQPPANMRAAPSVQYTIQAVPSHKIKRICKLPNAAIVFGCALRSYKALDPNADDWIIYTNIGLSSKELACTISHEKGHLPPNNWRH